MHTQQTQNICITFIQRRPNVFDVGPTLYKVIQMFCVHWVSKFKMLKDLGYITYKNCSIVPLYPLLTILLVSGVILSLMIALNYKTVH